MQESSQAVAGGLVDARGCLLRAWGRGLEELAAAFIAARPGGSCSLLTAHSRPGLPTRTKLGISIVTDA